MYGQYTTSTASAHDRGVGRTGLPGRARRARPGDARRWCPPPRVGVRLDEHERAANLASLPDSSGSDTDGCGLCSAGVALTIGQQGTRRRACVAGRHDGRHLHQARCPGQLRHLHGAPTAVPGVPEGIGPVRRRPGTRTGLPWEGQNGVTAPGRHGDEAPRSQRAQHAPRVSQTGRARVRCSACVLGRTEAFGASICATGRPSRTVPACPEQRSAEHGLLSVRCSSGRRPGYLSHHRHRGGCPSHHGTAGQAGAAAPDTGGWHAYCGGHGRTR